MANADHFASPPAAPAFPSAGARIATFFRVRAEHRKTDRLVRNLSDRAKRDIGLIGEHERSGDFDAELRRIRTEYAW